MKKEYLLYAGIAIALLTIVGGGFGIGKLLKRRRDSPQYQTKQETKAEKAQIKQDTQLADETLTQLSVFDPNYLKRFPDSYLLPGTKADEFVKKLRWEIWFFGARSTKMLAMFSALKHRVQVTQIFILYRNKYGRDMREDIKKQMTKSQVADLNKVIQNLPE